MNIDVIEGSGFTITHHARVRCQQRGIKNETLQLVAVNADMRTHAGSGCVAYRMSDRRISQLSKRTETGSALERAKNIVLVIDESENSVITVMHDYGGKAGRRYRRPHATHA